jgi:hypothetical protein
MNSEHLMLAIHCLLLREKGQRSLSTGEKKKKSAKIVKFNYFS